ncbi:MAG: hypothetical protein JO307_33300 [Bryobacterales bacterium]|nr:hypothetical protein [Bryobacterales bacterium]MBV9400745.1 hypothetical protein [Bryobacterales bacterium]
MTVRISNQCLALVIAIAAPALLQAQGRGGRGGGAATAKAMAPIDLTGYWVSIVNEDWRFRMVTPAPGDYQGVPMTAEARKVADAWDPAKDEAAGEQCKSYGAPALLRVPGHLHFTWQDDQTLRLDMDSGTQTRLFHFSDWKPQAGAPSLQGDSVATWEITAAGRGGSGAAADAPPQGKGTLKVATTHLKAGYLRKNGVPYSENATLTEYFDMIKERNGDTMLVVTTVTTDPRYLREPFIITSHFKKQAGDEGWKQTPCSAKW